MPGNTQDYKITRVLVLISGANYRKKGAPTTTIVAVERRRRTFSIDASLGVGILSPLSTKLASKMVPRGVILWVTRNAAADAVTDLLAGSSSIFLLFLS